MSTGEAAVCEPRHRPRVDPAIARSWLLIPATRPELFDDPRSWAADHVILDLEDGVSPSLKAEARAAVETWLSLGGSAWVRINDRTSEHWREDIEALREMPGLAGVMLAKTEDPDQVADTREGLGGHSRLIALIESAVGVEQAASIATAPGVFRLAFGSGDYRRDTGTNGDDLAMAYPRTRLVVASRVAGLPGPIDGPALVSSHAALRDSTERSAGMGMTGRLCLDPGHAAVVNESMGPQESEVVWAREFLAGFHERGGEFRDGSDLPRLRRAEKVLHLATAFRGAAGG